MSVFPRSSPARRILPHPGGRAVRACRPAAYDELNDHLGAARVVFHRPTTTRVVRQLELNEPQNNTAFTDENTYRTATASAHSPDYVARLDGRTAPAPMTRTIPLLQGDTVTFSAWSLIRPDFSNRAAPGPVKRLLARLRPLLLLGATTPPAQLIAEGPQPGTTTTATRWWGRAAAGVGLTLGGGPPPASLRGATSLSQAWIKYRLVYEDGTVDEHTEYVPLDPTWQTTRVAVRARQGGTLTLSVGTSETSGATYFDDLTVEQTGGMIVQEQHQYAYGSPLVGLNYAVGNKRYRYGYQGQFAEKDSETGFDSFELRLYNSRIGRWTSYDPEGQFNSPYVGMGNNPVSEVDPDGGFSGPGDGLKTIVRHGKVVGFREVSQAAVRGAIPEGSVQLVKAVMSPILLSSIRTFMNASNQTIPSPAANSAKTPLASGYYMPVAGQLVVSDEYNRPRINKKTGKPYNHGGTDITYKTPGAIKGQNITPILAGKVTKALYKLDGNSGGIRVEITSNTGLVVRYMHMIPGSNLTIRNGQWVTPNTIIGRVGHSTGWSPESPGIHLHLATLVGGKLVDPGTIVPELDALPAQLGTRKFYGR